MIYITPNNIHNTTQIYFKAEGGKNKNKKINKFLC